MSVGMKLGIFSELDAAAAGGGVETRLVGIGCQTEEHTDWWNIGRYQSNSNCQRYFKWGSASAVPIQAWMCTFYLDTLNQDVILQEDNYWKTLFPRVIIKTDGTVYYDLWGGNSGAGPGSITWMTAPGTIELKKNYMLVINMAGYGTNIISNVEMYLGTGGTVTNITPDTDRGVQTWTNWSLRDTNGTETGTAGYSRQYSSPYTAAVDPFSYTNNNHYAALAKQLVGSISAMHYWNNGVLTEAAITALYNGGTPLTDPSSPSGNYTSTFSDNYFDGSDFTHLSTQTFDEYDKFNDFSDFNYLAGSGGPEVTLQFYGDDWEVLGA